MTDETQRTGLGKVIYCVDEKNEEASENEERANQAEVQEAVEESFPASDPPSFAGGTSSDST